MLMKVVFYTLSYFANLIVAASADTCARASSVLSPDTKGVQYSLTSIPLHGDLENIPQLLYKETLIRLNNDPSIIFYTTSNFSFNIKIADSEIPYYGYLNEVNITLSNFVAIYDGLFVPPVTGDYTFSINEVSDGAAIYLYDNRDMYCCEDMDMISWLNKTTQLYYIPSDPNYQTDSVTVHLEAGSFYVYFYGYANYGGDAIFEPSVTFPSGQVVTNLTDYSYTVLEDISCDTGNSTSSILSQWTGTFTTTFSTSVVSTEGTGAAGIPYTDIQTVYYVLTPSSYVSSSVGTSSSIETSLAFTSDSTSELITSSVISISFESSTISLSSSRTQSSFDSNIEQSSGSASSVSLTSQGSLSLSTFKSSLSISSNNDIAVVSSTLFSNISSVMVSSTLTVVTSGDRLSNSEKLPSDVTGSSGQSYPSSFDHDSLTKESLESSTSTTFISTTSDVNVFSSASSTKITSESKTKQSTTKLTQSILHISSVSSKGSNHTENTGSDILFSTSIYTDIYGIIRSTVVGCPQISDYISSTKINTSQVTTSVVVTKSTNENVEDFLSTTTYTADNTAREQKTETAVANGKQSSLAVQLKSSTAVSSASINIQQTPNSAGKYTVELFFSVVLLSFPIFFI